MVELVGQPGNSVASVAPDSEWQSRVVHSSRVSTEIADRKDRRNSPCVCHESRPHPSSRTTSRSPSTPVRSTDLSFRRRIRERKPLRNACRTRRRRARGHRVRGARPRRRSRGARPGDEPAPRSARGRRIGAEHRDAFVEGWVSVVGVSPQSTTNAQARWSVFFLAVVVMGGSARLSI